MSNQTIDTKIIDLSDISLVELARQAQRDNTIISNAFDTLVRQRRNEQVIAAFSSS